MRSRGVSLAFLRFSLQELVILRRSNVDCGQLVNSIQTTDFKIDWKEFSRAIDGWCMMPAFMHDSTRLRHVRAPST